MKLTARMLLFILGTVILGMTVTSLLTYMQTKSMLTRSVEQTQISDSTGVVGELDALIEGMKTSVHLQSEGARTLNVLIIPKATAEEKAKEIIELGKQQIVALKERSNNVFEYVSIVDLTGKVVTSTNNLNLAINYAGEAFYKTALQSSSVLVSVPNISGATGNPGFYITDPIIDKKTNKAVGILLARVNILEACQKLITAVKMGKTGYALAVDKRGLVILHPKKENILKLDLSGQPFVKEALQKKQGVLTYKNAGEDLQAAFATSKTVDWVVITTAEVQDLLSPVTDMRNTAFAITAILILFVAIVIFVTVRGIIAALAKGVEFAEAVAAGNLDKTLSSDREDEIGALCRALQIMVTNLKKSLELAHNKTIESEAATVRAEKAVSEADAARIGAEKARQDGMLAAAGQLHESVEIVSAAAEELEVRIKQADYGTHEQAKKMMETRNAMEMMNDTVMVVARSANAASEVSKRTRARAEEGSKIVGQVVTGIARVHTQSLSLKTDMETLGKQAEAINQIMSVISDIADQTNLLALNAAIEAARAGDAGRGFAVVADEVRKLAEKTVGSTTQVGSAIKEIQQSTRKNIEAVEQTAVMITDATNLANESGLTLQDIVKLVDDTTMQVHDIAMSVERQSESSEAITRTVMEVADIADSTAQGMEHANNVIIDLASQATTLKNLVDEMEKVKN